MILYLLNNRRMLEKPNQLRGIQRNNHPALVGLKVSYYRDLLGEGWMIIFL